MATGRINQIAFVNLTGSDARAGGVVGRRTARDAEPSQSRLSLLQSKQGLDDPPTHNDVPAPAT